jgi:pimeloyl-ACP methyl ester carboxylesterase
MKKVLRFLFLLLVILGIAYLSGPNPKDPVYGRSLPGFPAAGRVLDSVIRAEEARHPVKPENEARILWFDDSLKQVTEYAVVYLHGFSASQEEGDPVHTDFARRYGCNLYLARLSGHGLDSPEALINLTADSYWESAKAALAVGKQLGKKVILMGTSTGGTQALQLAAAYPEDVSALVLLSPNIEINDPNAFLLNNPWGLQLARIINKRDYIQASDQRDIYRKHWYGTYRLEGAVALQEMIETTMTPETFQAVRQPLLLLYYYRDEQHQDPVVRVSAMRAMFEQLSTPDSLKKQVAIPGAGDHVIGSYIKSKDLASVQREIHQYAEQVLRLPLK